MCIHLSELTHAFRRRFSMDTYVPNVGAGDVANARGLGAGDVANARGRKASLQGDEGDFNMLQQWQEQALQPIKEDLVDWLNETLGCTDIVVDDFLGSLDNAVHLCKLAGVIQQKQDEARLADHSAVNGVVSKPKYRENASSGTWFARDNTASFLKWCTEHHIKQECMFETEGLVLHKAERSVILCLLELARLGMKYGIEPPNLIKMEAEIDRLEAGSDVFDSRGSVSSTDGRDSTDGEASAQDERGAGDENVQHKTRKPVKNDAVDKKVVEMSSTCRCERCFQVERVSEGRYIVGGRNMFVRLLQNRHLMVRVGGGWDTLEHYLDTHDPCRILEFKRNGDATRHNRRAKDGDYLQAKGRYKSAGARRKNSSAI